MRNVIDKEECVEKWRNDNACFLDGQPAIVVGWKLDWPMVAQLDCHLSVEFSWATVNRIMSGDRHFKSN